MRGGEPSVDLSLQGEQEHAEHALAELDAVLDDAVALMLVRGGRLLEGPAALERDEALPKCENGVLVVALQGHGLTSCDAEGAEALLGEGSRGHRALALARHTPRAHGTRLAVLGNEDG